MPLLERQALPRPAFGCGAGEHGADGSIAHAVASFVARERPARQRTKAHQQRYVPQFAPIVGRTKQTPYRHRLTGGSVQQGLSVAGDVRDSSPFCGATDKRYSLAVLCRDYSPTRFPSTTELPQIHSTACVLSLSASRVFVEWQSQMIGLRALVQRTHQVET